jgi:hypothetical protein
MYYRVNRNTVPQTIIFSGLTNINTKTWQLNFYNNESDVGVVSPVLQALAGSGLTLSSDRIVINLTAAQTNIAPRMYYYQLLNVTDNQTWINGRAYFHRGEFDNTSASGADTITINVAGITEAPIDGQQYARFNGTWAVVAGGGEWVDYVSVTGTTSIDSTGLGRVHICSGTAANYTVTLTVSAVGNAGKIIAFKGSPALTRFVTIDASGSEPIDGALTKVIWAQEYFAMVSDGATWIVFAQHARPLQCRLKLSAKQLSVANGLVPRKININQADVDNSLRMADAINFRVNIPRAGNYNVRLMCFIDNAKATFTRFIPIIYKNGSLVNSILSAETDIVIGCFKGANGSANLSLNAGDYIELYVLHNSSGSEDIFGSLLDGAYSGIDVIEIV